MYLAMAEYYGSDPRIFATVAALKCISVACAIGAVGGAWFAARQTYQDIKERRGILNTAREMGLQVSGAIFKRVS